MRWWRSFKFGIMHLIKPKYPPPASDPLHIFPTRHRDKHGKAVSFPLGAEALSRALDGIPQHAMIACHFYVGDMERRPAKPLEHVLHVAYSQQQPNVFTAASAAERGVFDPKWSITVFAVPGTARHQIKTLLTTDALPHVVRPWLIKNEGVTGRAGSTALVIQFDTVNGVLTSEANENLLPERV
jgi:hypothetical protein